MKTRDIIKIENRAFGKDTFEIRWRVTSLCNYRCEFCIQGDHDRHVRDAQGETAEIRLEICRALRGFLDGLTGYRRVRIHLIGGEITILKDLPLLVDLLAQSSFPGGIDFQITTNFSAAAEYYTRLADIMKRSSRANQRRHLQLAASFYPAYVSREEFIEKIRAVHPSPGACFSVLDRIWRSFCPGKKGASVFSLSVGYPILTDRDYADLLEMRKRLRIPVHPVWIREFRTDLSSATRGKMMNEIWQKRKLLVTDRTGKVFGVQNIQALGSALEDRDSFCPEGYLCDAGVNSFWVNAFGDVFRCPAKGREMKLGSILGGGFTMLSEPKPCMSEHCNCSEFGVIETKEREHGAAELNA